MPELPDIVVYIECLERRVVGKVLEAVRLGSPFLLRTVTPPLASCVGRRVTSVSRAGKRIVLELEEERLLVLHLMIAGRLRWQVAGAALQAKVGLAAFDFESGTLVLTEAGTKRRAALHVLDGRAGLASLDRGGLEVLDADLASFARVFTAENHTLKRALTDPRILSGIGNAYSDEILHRARLSPVTLTSRLAADELERLFDATRAVLTEWIERLRAEVGLGWPAKVTAFRPEMAVHGKHREPCPVCGAPIQRIVRGNHETNYCPKCQTGGRVLADRSLSKLLKSDWPRTLEELEERGMGAPPSD